MPGLEDIGSALSNAIAPVKSLYFSLEDKWYELLDVIDAKIPVNSVIDRVDKVVPSFLVFLVVVLGIIWVLFGGISAFSSALNTQYSVSFSLADSSGNPIAGALLQVQQNGKSFTLTSDDSGMVSAKFSPGKLTVSLSQTGYADFSQEFQVTKSESFNVILSLIATEKNRVLLVEDSSGTLISNSSILLKFSCSQGQAPQDILSSSGQISIIQPADCVQLFASVSADGFKSKSIVIDVDRVVVNLENSAAQLDDSTRGKIAVSVSDAVGNAIDAADIKLYKLISSTNTPALAEDAFSDASGTAFFQDLLPGKYYVTGSKGGFNLETSDTVDLISGQVQTIALSLPAASSEKLFFAKFLDPAGTPVKGVKVKLYVDANSGPNHAVHQLLATLMTDANGTARQLVGNLSTDVAMVAIHPLYLTIIQDSAPLISKTASDPTEIGLEDAKRDAKNNPVNFSEVQVQVKDNAQSAVENSLTSIYWDDANGLLLDAVATDKNGSALYSNLPAGSYQAIAQKNSFFGLSKVGSVQVAKRLALPIILQAGSSRIEVTVFDSSNQLVSGATVDFIDSFTKIVLSTQTTDSKGFLGQSLDANHSVYLKVSRAGFYSTTTESIALIQDNIQKKTVFLYSQSPNDPMSLSLERILELSGIPATAILPGKEYLFQYSILVPSSQLAVKTHHRVGKESDLSSDATNAVINSGISSSAVPLLSKTWDPKDDFLLLSPVSSAAKMAVLDFKDASAGVYSYLNDVAVKGSAVTGESLETRFRAKSSALSTPTYFQSFVLGDPILTQQGDFAYKFILQAKGSSKSYQVDEFTTLNLDQNTTYVLSVDVTNTSDNNFQNASLDFSSTLSSLTINPSAVSIGKFLTGQKFSTSVELTPTALASVVQVKVELKNVTGTNTKKFLTFQVLLPAVMNVSMTPLVLLANSSNTVTAVISDSSTGQLLGTVDGTSVMFSYFAPDGSSLGQDFLTDDAFKIFSLGVKALADRSTVKVDITNPSYAPYSTTLSVSSTGGIQFGSGSYPCVAISPTAVTDIPQGFSKSFAITALNCSEDVFITLNGQAGDEVLSTSPAMSREFLLGKNASKTVTIFADKHLGIYPVFVNARYASSTLSSPIQEVDATVIDSNPNKCFGLSKYSFTLLSGGDSATLTNSCFSLDRQLSNPLFTLSSGHAFIPVSSGAVPYAPGAPQINLFPSINAKIFESNSSLKTINGDVNLFYTAIVSLNTKVLYPLGAVQNLLNNFSDLYNYDTNVNSGKTVGIYSFSPVESPTANSIFFPPHMDRADNVLATYVPYSPIQPSGNATFTDFNVLNVNLIGTDYSLLTVQDNVPPASGQDYNLTSFDYSVFPKGSSTPTVSGSASIPLDGAPHRVNGVPLGSYNTTSSNSNVTVYVAPGSGAGSVNDVLAIGTQLVNVNYLPVPSGNKNLEVRFLIDGSPSMDPTLADACTASTGTIAVIEKQLQNLGWVLTPGIITMGKKLRCAADFTTWLKGNSSYPSGKNDTNTEAWGPDTIGLGNKSPWLAGKVHMAFVITDNDPTGESGVDDGKFPDVGGCYWRYQTPSKKNGCGNLPTEVDFANELIADAHAKNYSVSFLYPSPYTLMESINTDDLTSAPFDPNHTLRPDAMELMEMVASNTGGIALPLSSVAPGHYVTRNYLSALVEKATPPVKSETYHVKLTAGSANLCTKDNGIQGITGHNAYLPQIQLNWNWDANESDGIGRCDVSNPSAVYCDSTQFTQDVIEKLELIKEGYGNHNLQNLPSLVSFDAYLEQDGFSPDFQKDFSQFYNSSNPSLPIEMLPPLFFNAANGFESWDAYLSDTSKMTFLDASNPSVTSSTGFSLSSPGLYRVNFSFTWKAGTGVFFAANLPAATVTVSLQKLSPPLADNPLYHIPFDGMVGWNSTSKSFERTGYGANYAGEQLPIVKEGGIDIETVSSNSNTPVTVNGTLNQNFFVTNIQNRGSVMTISKSSASNYQMQFSPSDATPVLMKLVSDGTSNIGNNFYFVSNNGAAIVPSSAYMDSWLGISSTLPYQGPICSDFYYAPLLNYKGDQSLRSLPNNDCRQVPSLNTSAAFGLPFSQPAAGTIYYETVLYTPTNSPYSLQPACTNSVLFFAPTGTFVGSSNPAGIPLNYTPNSFGSFQAVKDFLSLVEQEYLCVSSDSNSLDFWWNPSKLHQSLLSSFNSSQLSDFQACPNIYVN